MGRAAMRPASGGISGTSPAEPANVKAAPDPMPDAAYEEVAGRYTRSREAVIRAST